MSKQQGRVPKIAKLTGANGTVVIDVESGILIGVSNDVELVRTSARGDVAERRSQPPGNPSSKLTRN